MKQLAPVSDRTLRRDLQTFKELGIITNDGQSGLKTVWFLQPHTARTSPPYFLFAGKLGAQACQAVFDGTV